MNRRKFLKLLAGAVGVAAVPEALKAKSNSIISGPCHGFNIKVPKEGTYTLKEGEQVLNPSDITNMKIGDKISFDFDNKTYVVSGHYESQKWD